MMPVGPLMIEHRLIKRMIKIGEMGEFDKNMIHEKYAKVVKSYEGQ